MLTSSDCEGAGEVFQIVADADVRAITGTGTGTAEPSSIGPKLASFWSGAPAYLTVSSQLHLEAIGLGLSRVWTLNPAFRAEGSATNRHLAEFWMLEAEMYWTSGDEDGRSAMHTIMDCTEGMVKAGLRAAMGDPGSRAREDLLLAAPGEAHLRMLEHVVSTRWPRLSYTQALEQLRQEQQQEQGSAPEWGAGLASEHERLLAAQAGVPVFVTDFPRDTKPFYMRANPDGCTAACFDLLLPGLGELVGGSVREERPARLRDNLVRAGLAASPSLAWYTDHLRTYGSAPHAGFGLGMERLLAWVTRTENVRDVNTFARTKGPVRF